MMISSVSGIATVALPASILTAGYMNEIEKHEEESKENNDSPEVTHEP